MTTTPTAAKKKKPLYKDLFFQVIVGIVLGVLVGYAAPQTGIAMKPLGDGFINLIKMMIAPIIFCTIVTGVAGMGDMKQVGRVGGKALLYFEIITTIALIMGLVVVNILKPGMGMNIDASSVDVSAVQKTISSGHMKTTVEFVMDIIPHTFVSAFSQGEILQVLLIALLFASALSHMGKAGQRMIDNINDFSHILFQMINIITKLSPLGAFGAMAYTIGKFGVGSLKDLGELLLIFYITCAVFIVVILGGVLRFYCKMGVFSFIRYIREELLIVIGTSSSETVLPRMIEKMTHLGCSKPVVGMVIPTGYSFNLDGTSIYLTMAAIFIAYATNTELTLWHQLTLLGILLLTSKGAAGVTGSGFIILAATLGSMKIMPDEALTVGLALIFAVDRFMSTGRALTNLIGNGIATVVVAKWENALDEKQAHAVLNAKK
jgi:aerobic C4-dicarboxylate transport protein